MPFEKVTRVGQHVRLEPLSKSHRDGRVRDSVLFSITDYKWAGVKQNLSYKLQRDA